MTLVELLIVLAVFSLVMGAVLSIFTTSLKAFWKGDLNTQVQQGGRLSLDRISRELRASRRLITGVTQGGFTFNLTCSPNPQISFVLPHMVTVTLSDGTTSAYVTDANGSGTNPYDGWYVSYYLAATPGSATQNATGPYLIRKQYDLVGLALSTTTVATNITSLAILDRATSACPTAGASGTRDVKLTVTASQTATGQGITATDVVSSDVTLRNQ
jgi:type II secretory pathway pseudopilin PulG